jgi:hypothetical protein
MGYNAAMWVLRAARGLPDLRRRRLMKKPDADKLAAVPPREMPNPNGRALATLRPHFITHPNSPDHGPAREYVITRTLLGQEALTWAEPWLAGLFSITEIMAHFQSMPPAWAQGLYEALHPGGEFDPVRAAAWEAVRRADAEGWTTVSTLPPKLLSAALTDSFSQTPLPEDAFGASIHGVVRWRDPVLLAKDARARRLFRAPKALPPGSAKKKHKGRKLLPPSQRGT